MKNNPAKFHPDPIWNDGALGFCEEVAPAPNKKNKKNNKNKKSSDMRSVPGPKNGFCFGYIFINYSTDNVLVCLFCLSVVQNHVINGCKVLTAFQQCGRTLFRQHRHCCYWWRWCWWWCWIWTASMHVHHAASSDAVSIYSGYYRLAVKLYRPTFKITIAPKYQNLNCDLCEDKRYLLLTHHCSAAMYLYTAIATVGIVLRRVLFGTDVRMRSCA